MEMAKGAKKAKSVKPIRVKDLAATHAGVSGGKNVVIC
jgi:hypothetical protein